MTMGKNVPTNPRATMADSGYTLTIKPRSGWIGINVRELWRFRELFYIFAWRDFKVRYKQMAIGVAWAVLQPFVAMVIFSVFFGGLAKIPSDGIPYPIFVYSGLLFWNYFSHSLGAAGNSLISNEAILKKIYFPRLLLPMSATITPLVDFGFALVVLVGIMVYYQFAPSLVGVFLLPVLVLLSFLSATGLGAFLAAINVRYRDVREALPFVIQTLFFVTPVIYPTTLLPERFRWLLGLNPMTGVVEAARAGIVQDRPVNVQLVLVSAAIAVTLFLVGIFYFRRTERVFADVA